MNKYEELSSEIIDMVEEIVLEQHPEIKLNTKIAKESGIESPAVVCGEQYYSLEGRIAGEIKEFMRKKC